MSWLIWFAIVLLLVILVRYLYLQNLRVRRAAEARPDPRVDLLRPENSGIAKYLEREASTSAPTEILAEEPTALERQLNDTVRRCTEAETLEVLWDEWNGSLPVDCRSIVYGKPVLVHPKTGILFALAMGRGCWAVRLLQEQTRKEREEIGGVFFESTWAKDVSSFGKGWLPLGNRELCQSAYECAGVEEGIDSNRNHE